MSMTGTRTGKDPPMPGYIIAAAIAGAAIGSCAAGFIPAIMRRRRGWVLLSPACTDAAQVALTVAAWAAVTDSAWSDFSAWVQVSDPGREPADRNIALRLLADLSGALP